VERRFGALWERLTQWGVSEQVLRIGTHAVTILLVGAVVVAMRGYFLGLEAPTAADLRATAEAVAAPTLEAITGHAPVDIGPAAAENGGAGGAALTAFNAQDFSFGEGIGRKTVLDTTIPTRERVDILPYEVEAGDNLFSIADKFGLAPTTLFWGNLVELGEDPRVINPGQMLNILPVDGVLHRWSTGESLEAVARFYDVDVQTVIEWPGNDLDPFSTDPASVQFGNGEAVIIPGGRGPTFDPGPPAITRDNPAVASYYGAGSCGVISEGAIGNGTFVWPTTSAQISGFTYDPDLHPAIDIGGSEGNAIYAVDGGVVVYAGWSDYGYGFLIVIDHGTGWQSAYAHLSGVGVFCGQSVAQGTQIGGLGSTGNSSGPHLHFELLSSLYGKVNPLNFLVP
jgi:murein DD-endopeptidase MepM/ murein hydrolase activator NlpD